MLDDYKALVEARNAYAYAPFCLRRADSGARVDAVLWGIPVVISGPEPADAPRFEHFSSAALDRYHGQLLHSDHDSDVLLGVASVTFWGFAQGRGGRFTTARALARAKHIAGLGKRSADDGAVIVEAVRSIAVDLAQARRADAIARAMRLKHHGLAFASKLLAFIAPATECVYDEVISLRLKASTDQRLIALHVPTVGQHRMTEKAQAYVGWAELCSSTAQGLDAAGRPWTDWNGEQQAWRAVDVERAFFGLGRPSAD
ncbi:hypothetical protein D8I30_11020 [Brevundimonas naejangsanensis]|uniref:Uncharacterized protein n=1 Tax=Brevundimonas naejangsanensis TaxID=588932 RepID=A0A494RQ36_9CAUL|nr:hypothetical protein [Brevundimonas naejangsanensis]AYG95654.1 hypothetical protein D8I30_11020 [Brevundimonas naejangsanensis]